MTQEPVYLGDGLYAQFNGWQIRLYASNGVSTQDQVFLEPHVLANFLNYIKPLQGAAA